MGKYGHSFNFTTNNIYIYTHISKNLSFASRGTETLTPRHRRSQRLRTQGRWGQAARQRVAAPWQLVPLLRWSHCSFYTGTNYITIATHTHIYIYVCIWDEHVCMSVCLYVCMSVCVHVCMSLCLYVSMSVCLYACMPICLYVCLPVCLPACLYVCTYACMDGWMPVCPSVRPSVCLFVCVCAPVCMYVCMHACYVMYVCNLWLLELITWPIHHICMLHGVKTGLFEFKKIYTYIYITVQTSRNNITAQADSRYLMYVKISAHAY